MTMILKITTPPVAELWVVQILTRRRGHIETWRTVSHPINYQVAAAALTVAELCLPPNKHLRLLAGVEAALPLHAEILETVF